MAKMVVRTAIGAAGLIAGGIVAMAGATSASAAPSGCQLTQASHSASAVCGSGTGQYRVAAVCQDPQHGTENTYYGSYVGVGGTSTVNCPKLGGYTWYEVSAKIQVK